MPHVMHSPRVEPGTTGATSISFGRNIDADAGSTTYLPSLYAALRHGRVADDGASAWSVGAQLQPLLMVLGLRDRTTDFAELALATSYVDLYAQPRGLRRPDRDAGVGVLFSSALVSPYVQFGRFDADGQGVYTTQAVGVTREPLYEGGWFWLPSLMWRETGREGSAAHLGISAGIGGEAGESVWWLSLHATIEWGLRPGQR